VENSWVARIAAGNDGDASGHCTTNRIKRLLITPLIVGYGLGRLPNRCNPGLRRFKRGQYNRVDPLKCKRIIDLLPSLSLPKISSGPNAFEIREIQE
jgi:hypothetical protein